MSDKYFIASLKHTNKHHEHITWWGPNHCGYTPVVGEHIGEYASTEAESLNNGIDHIAVPVDVVKAMLSPEPYYKPGARFYDQRGPVIDNTRAVWDVLIAKAMPGGFGKKPKPEIFRGNRRSFAWQEVA